MTTRKDYQKPINTYSSKKNLGRALEEVSEGYIVLNKESNK